MALQNGVAGAEVLQISCSETPAGTFWSASGPRGAEFVVEASADLREWTPVYADRFGTGPSRFVDPVREVLDKRFYRAVLKPAALDLGDLTFMNAAPLSLLSLDVSGLKLPSDEVCARFFDDKGFIAEIPAVQVGPGGAVFPVPVEFAALWTEAGAGTVDLHVLQRIAGTETISRTIHGFSIDELPHLAHPPGTVVIHFLEGAVVEAQSILQELPGTPFDTFEIRQALSECAARTTDLAALLRQAQGAIPPNPVPLGTLGNRSLVLDGRVLATLDRLVLGLLRAQGAGIGKTSALATLTTGTCARAEADAYANALLHDPESAGNPRSAYYRAHGRCSASAFERAYQIIAGAGGVGLSLAALVGAPAEALALASGALLYITAEVAGGLIALSGALGQESPAAAQLLKTGVEMTEELLRGPAKSVVDDATGPLLDLAASAASLKAAFAATSLNPGPVTGVHPETISLGSVGGCGGGTLNGTIEIRAPTGVAWTLECFDAFEEPALKVLSESGIGSATISISIVAAPQEPTPGFTCDNLSLFPFSHVLDATFANGAFASVLVQYEYQLVL